MGNPISEAFFSVELQSQIFSLFIITITLIVISLIVYFKVKKQKVDQAPKGIVFLAEQYVMGVENFYQSSSEGKLQKPGPYIFTLITFLLAGNLIGLLGLEPVTSSYSVTLVLALVSWMGIYVVGILYQKLRFFKKYLNPLNLISQFSPLISLSFRLFGNIIGGVTIMFLVYYVTGLIWNLIPVIGEFNILGSIIAPPFHFYFDVFGGIIQAYVFTLLTIIYWTIEAEPSKEEIEKAKTKSRKNQTIAKRKQKLNKLLRS